MGNDRLWVEMPDFPAFFDQPMKQRKGKKYSITDVELLLKQCTAIELFGLTGATPDAVRNFLDEKRPMWSDVRLLNYGLLLKFYGQPNTFCTKFLEWVFGSMPVLVFDNQNRIDEKRTLISMYKLLNGQPMSFAGYKVVPCTTETNPYPFWVIGDPFEQMIGEFIMAHLTEDQLRQVATQLGVSHQGVLKYDLRTAVLQKAKKGRTPIKKQLVEILRGLIPHMANAVPEWM